MITDEQYLDWRLDTTRDPHRVVLLECAYSDKYEGPGHGRDNFSATLNPVTRLKATVYGFNKVDIEFVQPTSQEGYTWEVWIDGVIMLVTSGGSYTIDALEDKLYKVAVNSRRGNSYSDPWLLEFTPQGVQDVYYGDVGDWQDVGGGKGSEGTGVLRLASDPYISASGLIYDDFLVDEPSMEQSLDDFEGIGSFRAINATNELVWRNLYWRGHTFNMLYGDEEWPLQDFRPVASAMIEDCRNIDGSVFQFDLMDGGQQFKRHFARTAQTLTSNVAQTLSDVADLAFLPAFNYVNVPSTKLNYSTLLDLDEETRIEDVVRVIANSIRAKIRINQRGGIDIFVPQEFVSQTLTGDDIIDGKVRMIESTPAVRRVVLELATGQGSVKGTTQAATGELVETITIRTVLNNFNHADVVLQEYLDYYSFPHAVWELGVLDVGLMQVGDKITIDHYDLQGTGVVKRIKRRPLSPYSLVDVEI